jgi:hypothetical protein
MPHRRIKLPTMPSALPASSCASRSDSAPPPGPVLNSFAGKFLNYRVSRPGAASPALASRLAADRSLHRAERLMSCCCCCARLNRCSRPQCELLSYRPARRIPEQCHTAQPPGLSSEQTGPIVGSRPARTAASVSATLPETLPETTARPARNQVILDSVQAPARRPDSPLERALARFGAAVAAKQGIEASAA